MAQILFLIVLASTAYALYLRIRIIRKNIKMGRTLTISGDRGKRWKNVFLIAFGQKKMFKRLVPAALHFVIYAGFFIINIEILEFIIDGLTGQHRTFALLIDTFFTNTSGYSSFYNILMNLFEFLAVGITVACIIFLVRRNILRLKRFSGIEMTRWPLLDANLILVFEIILMLAILTMNASDQLLQRENVEGYLNTGPWFFSTRLIGPLLEGMRVEQLIIIERVAWWLHIIGIFGFAVYVTYSKHLHIALAFPNTYYSRLDPQGTISNMEDVMNEVKSMLGMPTQEDHIQGDILSLGVKDVTDLTWKNLMDAFTCTECGRCTSVCPAHITGKKLSPRKIMMDVRDRVEQLGLTEDRKDEQSLFDRISREEIFACTTCNACVEACPVSIDPVSVIIGMRRYTAMEESTSPADWNIMFNNIETSFSPWKFPASDRSAWMNEMNSKNAS